MKSILYYFENIQDHRKNQGKRYQLKSILGLIVLGYMSGCTSLAKVHRFGKDLNKTSLKRMGFSKGNVPSHPTITETIKRIDPQEFERVLSNIVNKSIGDSFKQIAIDGKSIRSTYENKEGLLHLVSAYATEANGVLSQVKSTLAGGEINAAKKVLKQINIKNKVITGDALFAQDSLCTQIVNSSGDYVFKVKRNKKRIVNDIDQKFTYHQNKKLPVATYTSETSKAHGRIESRSIEAIGVEDGYFAGLTHIKQIARIKRNYIVAKTGVEKSELHYIISSLSTANATPQDLLKFSVNHWSIENNLHRVRDVNFREDISNIICHKSQQINAAMRNFAIFLLTKIHNSITHAIESVTKNIHRAFTLLFRRI